MNAEALKIDAIDWWYRSAHMVEQRGATVVPDSTLLVSGTPTLTILKDYEAIFIRIVEALDVRVMLMAQVSKPAPESSVDSYIDHILIGKSGATLHLRVDANEGAGLATSE